MIARLNTLMDAMTALNSKLILLVGSAGCGKTALLAKHAEEESLQILSLGARMAPALAQIPRSQRHLQAAPLLRTVADQQVGPAPLLLDNLELLFDASLKLNPMSLLRGLAQSRVVVAAWPSELRDTDHGPRLCYAELGHPEHRDYAVDGAVTFSVHH